MKRFSTGHRKNIKVMAFLQLLLTLVMLVWADPSTAFSVKLVWDPCTDADLAGYKVYYQPNSAAIPFQGAGSAEGSAPIEVVNSVTATINGLDPGNSYFFALTAYNTAGEESPYSNIVEVAESIQPVVSITSPAPNATVTGVVSIEATASDNTSVAKVQFFVNGQLYSTDTAAPYGFSWNTSTLTSGTYSVLAQAYDAAGNAGNSEISLVVGGDTVPPAVSLLQPLNNAAVRGDVTVVASATDNVAASRIELFVDGSLVFASNESSVNFTWKSAFETNGSHLLAAKAYDPAGNVGEAAVVLSVANDFANPSILLSSPSNGISVEGVVEVAATATDDVGVDKVEFYIDDVLHTTVSMLPYRFNWNTAAIANGSYTLSAKAYDAAGNVARSSEVVVNVSNDTTAPVVSIVSPVNNSTVGGPVVVSVSASDNRAVTRVEFFVDRVLRGTSTTAPYWFSLSSSDMANGMHSLTVKAYDAAGNMGQAESVTLNVQNDLSAPSISSFTMPTTLNSTTVQVATFSAMDDVGVTGFLITETANVPSAYAEGWSVYPPISFTFSGSGSRTAYAWVKDAAGHVSGASPVTVLVDTVLPVIGSMTLQSASTYVTINAFATDNTAVTKMQLYIDGALVSEVTGSSISYDWVPTSRRPQKLSLYVFDAAGNVRTRTLSALKF